MVCEFWSILGFIRCVYWGLSFSLFVYRFRDLDFIVFF